MRARAAFGFSLIELMIALAIVAILATIAIPSYQRYMLEARRTDATTMLQRVAMAQEQYLFTNNKYTDNAADELGLADGGVITSAEGYYTVAITQEGGDTTYVLTATPVVGGIQANDADCTAFTLDHTGKRGATGGGTAEENLEKCWRR